MTVKEYHIEVGKQYLLLQRTRTHTITAEKYVEPIRRLASAWPEISASLTDSQKAPEVAARINSIDIVVADLANEAGKEKRPRLVFLRKLRNLRQLLYPLTLMKGVDLLGTGLVVFQQNNQFALYNYLKGHITAGKKRVSILDSYVSAETLNFLYGLPRDIEI